MEVLEGRLELEKQKLNDEKDINLIKEIEDKMKSLEESKKTEQRNNIAGNIQGNPCQLNLPTIKKKTKRGNF